MGSPTFNPTFTHAFYRAANVGCVRLASAALVQQPLSQQHIDVLTPFGEIMGVNKTRVAQSVHASFFDVVRAQEAGDVRNGILAQIRMAWAITDISEGDLADAAKLIGMSEVTTGSLFSTQKKVLKQVRRAMKASTYVSGIPGKRGRKSTVSTAELIWTLKRHYGNMSKAAEELGIDYQTFLPMIRRARDKRSAFREALQEESRRDPLFQPTALFLNIKKHNLSASEGAHSKGYVLMSGARLLADANTLRTEDVDRFLGMADIYDILYLGYTELFRVSLYSELNRFREQITA